MNDKKIIYMTYIASRKWGTHLLDLSNDKYTNIRLKLYLN